MGREMVHDCVQCETCVYCGRKELHERIYCDECGADIDDESLIKEWDGKELCEDCYKEHFCEYYADKYTFAKALELGEEVEIEINSYVLWKLGKRKINEILEAAAAEDFYPGELIDWLGEDYESILPTPEEVIKKLKGDTK